MFISMFVYLSTHIYTYIHIHTCIHTDRSIYVYTYIYIYTYIHIRHVYTEAAKRTRQRGEEIYMYVYIQAHTYAKTGCCWVQIMHRERYIHVYVYIESDREIDRDGDPFFWGLVHEVSLSLKPSWPAALHNNHGSSYATAFHKVLFRLHALVCIESGWQLATAKGTVFPDLYVAHLGKHLL